MLFHLFAAARPCSPISNFHHPIVASVPLLCLISHRRSHPTLYPSLLSRSSAASAASQPSSSPFVAFFISQACFYGMEVVMHCDWTGCGSHGVSSSDFGCGWPLRMMMIMMKTIRVQVMADGDGDFGFEARCFELFAVSLWIPNGQSCRSSPVRGIFLASMSCRTASPTRSGLRHSPLSPACSVST